MKLYKTDKPIYEEGNLNDVLMVEFKSSDEFFQIEKHGLKSNTIRRLTAQEWSEIEGLYHEEKLKYIRISALDGFQYIENEIKSIRDITTVLKLENCIKTDKIVVFSW